MEEAILIVAGRTDVSVDAKFTVERSAEDTDVGVPQLGFGDEVGVVVVVASGAVDEEVFF